MTDSGSGRRIVIALALALFAALACKENPAPAPRAPQPAVAAARVTPDAISRPGPDVVEHAVAILMPLPGIKGPTRPRGTLRLELREQYALLAGNLVGLRQGPHALHIHEHGDCSTPDAAGGHFNPDAQLHGAPTVPVYGRHAGDLGNIHADKRGHAQVSLLLDRSLLEQGPRNVLGRSIVVHAGRDDFVSQPGGDAGARLACGVIRAGTAREEAKAPRVD